jgi:hypothetical protein
MKYPILNHHKRKQVKVNLIRILRFQGYSIKGNEG